MAPLLATLRSAYPGFDVVLFSVVLLTSKALNPDALELAGGVDVVMWSDNTGAEHGVELDVVSGDDFIDMLPNEVKTRIAALPPVLDDE